MRLLRRSITFKAILLAFVSTYVSAVALSVVLAHVLVIWVPQSGAAERIVLPVVKGLEFLDIHWKSILVLLALPFFAPFVKDLIARITKIGSIEFGVPLEPIGVREKPLSAGNSQ
jgi:hypothetical protein